MGRLPRGPAGEGHLAPPPAGLEIFGAPAGPGRRGPGGPAPPRPRLPHAQRVARVDLLLASARRGKAERECRLKPRLAFHADPAAVQLRDRLDDRQTQTRSGRGFLARAARAVEAIEDARQVLCRDPGAGVGYL